MILEYIESFAKHFQLYQHIQVNSYSCTGYITLCKLCFLFPVINPIQVNSLI